jgi:hypothetical protein
MARKPLEFTAAFGRHPEAKYISLTWFNYNSQRFPTMDRWKELRNYIFATDTTTTTNRDLPWKNSTTLPKLCQIRDNLHSNYISALFPNDEWLKWEGYSQDDATVQKKRAIEAYMANKTRESHYRREISKLVYDYIDYGNAFATTEFEATYKLDRAGKKIPDYVGPKLRRISPYDIVFNPLASSFRDSFKIIRSLKSIGELEEMARVNPDNKHLAEAMTKRHNMVKNFRAYGIEEAQKAEGFMVDGFGSYSEYLQSGYVEVLDFYGDIHSNVDNTYQTQRVITIIDRMWVIRNDPIPGWLGHDGIHHVGWRTRPDNLWAMGPLENLVGMQYRIDHLENLKSDAMDLAVLPPLVIKGDVEQFTYGPGEEIHLDENGEVTELARNVQWVIQCDNSINLLEQRMEQFAGAPKEAMGIRTAGEKTAFEVQQLQNAAGRIFKEKTDTFELEMLEPTLNDMLIVSREKLDGSDIVSVMNDDLGVKTFISINRNDIVASGKLRPIGSRHFAAQAQLVQNITAMSQTPIWQMVAPHASGQQMAKLVEDVLGLSRYQLFRPNVAITEAQETERMKNQATEDLMVEQQVNK